MPRPKRSSPTVEKAQRRAAAVKAIDPNLDLGNGLTIQTFLASIQEIQAKLDDYNTMLSTLDQMALAIDGGERLLSEMTERMLTGVAFKYGRYSDEYVMAGGSQRPSRRKSRSSSGAKTEESATPVFQAGSEGVNGSTNGVVNGATVK